ARAEFPDATHHCSASRIAGATGVEERAHDAGEPAGTAGPPILQAIRSAGLANVAVVVTRWFGGTKLGKGGLARAYRAAAAAALEGAVRVEEVPRIERRLIAPLSRDGEIRNLLARHGGVILEAVYEGGEQARFAVRLPAASEAVLRRELNDLTGGAARLETLRPGDAG
ncbi:MAG: YigZ family protein, partial [Candidatus Polarisedimenticolia bacterium]